jgi:TolB-like protein
MKLKNHVLPLLAALGGVFAKQKLLSSILAGMLILSTCASSSVGSGPDELDIAIRDASDYLNENIPQGNKVVIINMQSDYANLSEYIIDELIANAVRDRVFSVVDRAQLEQIRMELNFQFSGEVDDQSALEIGKFIGAQTIVTGTISELGDRYRIRIRALNVETAEVQGQFNSNINPSRTIAALMRGGRAQTSNYGTPATRTSRDDTGGQTAQTQTPTGQPQSSPQGSTQPTGIKNGTYTLWPRPRATQAGLPINFYIAQIIASGDYIVFFFARSGEGDFSNGHTGFWYPEAFSLQDLDNPSRFYNPVQANRSSNGMGTIWSLSFRRFPATRFKITANGGYPYGSEPIIWEEIIPGEPDQ